MPALRVLSGREVRSILEANGFTLMRQSGSHLILHKHLEGGTLVVSVPNHHTLKIGTLSSIIRQSGLDRSLFETE